MTTTEPTTLDKKPSAQVATRPADLPTNLYYPTIQKKVTMTLPSWMTSIIYPDICCQMTLQSTTPRPKSKDYTLQSEILLQFMSVNLISQLHWSSTQQEITTLLISFLPTTTESLMK